MLSNYLGARRGSKSWEACWPGIELVCRCPHLHIWLRKSCAWCSSLGLGKTNKNHESFSFSWRLTHLTIILMTVKVECISKSFVGFLNIIIRPCRWIWTVISQASLDKAGCPYWHRPDWHCPDWHCPYSHRPAQLSKKYLLCLHYIRFKTLHPFIHTSTAKFGKERLHLCWASSWKKNLRQI